MPKKKKTTKTSDSGKGKKKKNYLGPILRLLLAVVIVGLIVWEYNRLDCCYLGRSAWPLRSGINPDRRISGNTNLDDCQRPVLALH
jgi:hypothetical protein